MTVSGVEQNEDVVKQSKVESLGAEALELLHSLSKPGDTLSVHFWQGLKEKLDLIEEK